MQKQLSLDIFFKQLIKKVRFRYLPFKLPNDTIYKSQLAGKYWQEMINQVFTSRYMFLFTFIHIFFMCLDRS